MVVCPLVRRLSHFSLFVMSVTTVLNVKMHSFVSDFIMVTARSVFSSLIRLAISININFPFLLFYYSLSGRVCTEKKGKMNIRFFPFSVHNNESIHY